MPSLKKLAISGAIWTLVGNGASQGLRLVSNIILTRLLSPDLFGMMAVINSLMTGLNQFSDIGIRGSIIHSSRGDDPNFINTAWTVQVLRGFALWGVCLLIAYPIASFYDQKQFLWLIPIVGINPILNGFSSTAILNFNREIKIKRITIFEQSAQILSIIVMIIWAWFSPTIWSLIAGGLVSYSVKMILSHVLMLKYYGYFNRFQWESESVKELIGFGRWIFISTAMLFLASQADRFMLGKLLSFTILGIYTVAFTFADLPRFVAAQISFKVVFPLISKYNHLSRKQLRKKITKVRGKILLGLAFLMSLLISFGDFLILQLYDDRYAQGAWMLPILALGIWPTILFQTTNPLLLAIGKPIYGAIGQALKLLYMLIILPLVFYWLKPIGLELVGVIIVIAFNDLPPYLSNLYGASKEQLLMIKEDLLGTLQLSGFILMFLVIRHWLNLGLPIDQIFDTI